MDNYEQGINTLNELLTEERANAIRKRFMELSPTFESEAVSVVFGRTWSRDALDAKTRALCSIGILAALGRQGALKIVFEIALRNGASQEEIVEALLHVAIYAGYPAALDALGVLEGVVAAQKKESTAL
jgi:4-carboxymuconolactone decarboxylase